jgi:hypothetical protein
MKHCYLVFLLVALSTGLFAQTETNSTPPSFRHEGFTTQPDLRQLAAPDLSQTAYLDEMDRLNGNPYRMALGVSALLDMQNSGTWAELPDHSGRIWQLSIRIPAAQALIAYYNQFYIPNGCALYLYNASKKQVLGPFTSSDNPETGYYATGMTDGESCTLEYFEPAGVTEPALISIEEVGYVYRGAGMADPSIVSNKSGTCEIDIKCSEGNNWQDEKKGVCKLLTKIGSNTYMCSGSLMNNTLQDCTPYILTADHCAYDGGYATTINLSQWLFYFHYDASTCNGSYVSGQKVKTGCTLIAHDTYGSNNVGSDFFLVRLVQTPTVADGVYYNGWSKSTTASTSGVSIHHPAGDVKKISTYTATLTSAYLGAVGSHWSVTWVATTNGHGVTEGGSSGSPIFNALGQVVGTLTGGGSLCTSPTLADYYGKFSYHWQTNGTTTAKQLKPWLDPNNSGVTTLAGSATCTPAAIHEIETLDAQIYLYPNPATDYVHVALGETVLDNPVIRLYSQLGPMVLEQRFNGKFNNELLIDISGQASGLYFLSLESGNKIIKKKIMILQ